MSNTQLTSAMGYNTDQMTFSDPQHCSIPNTMISYKRIVIGTKNPDGTYGDLILPTEELFSFGLGENTNMETGKVNGYTLPLCLWDRMNPTKEQKEWTNTFDKIVEKCKDHILEVREEIEQYNLERSDLKKLNPLYWKRERGKIVEGTGPTLYLKLIVSKKENKIISNFYDSEGEYVDPMTLKGKYCFAKCAVKFESIFIGNKISLQVKLYESVVRLVDTGMKRLLGPQKKKPMIMSSAPTPVPTPTNESESESEDSDSGSGSESEDDITPPVKTPPATKGKRKVNTRGKKK